MSEPTGTTPPPMGLGRILRQIGPGLVLTATIVGSGELIVTPKLASQVGFSLLWFIILGCIVKVFVQVELGRIAVSRGLTTLEAMNMTPGPRFIVSWVVWLWLLMYLAVTFQVAGIVGGIATIFVQLGSTLDLRIWAALTTAGSVALLLAGGYGLLERLSTAMVVMFTLCTVVAVGALQWTGYRVGIPDLAEGFKFRLEGYNTAFAVFGIIGVGATELIYYPYWCLEKGYAVRVGEPDGSSGWMERAKGWIRVMRWDAWFSLVIYTMATIAFYILGAAVLHRDGLKVEDKDMIATLSNMYLKSFGPWALWVFLIGAFFVLYSTLYGATAANARLFADGLSLFRQRRYGTTGERQKMIRAGVVGLSALSLGIYILIPKPVTLVFVGAIAQGLMLPPLCITALWFHHRKTEPGLRPGRAWSVALWIACLSMTAAGLYQVVDKIREKIS